MAQIFPDVSVAEVEAATGFELRVAGDLRQVAPPSVAELAAVRSVDPLRVRAQEFSSRDLSRVFEREDSQNCAC